MDWYDLKLRRNALKGWLSSVKQVRIPSGFFLFLIQILGCAAVIYGIWLYSHPISFIIGGILAVVAVEQQTRGEQKMTAEQVAYAQNQLRTALAAGEDPFGPPYNVPLTQEWIAYATALRRRS